jgi:hypothetical protein
MEPGGLTPGFDSPPLLTEDEIAFVAYLKHLRRLIAQGVIRDEDPFPEDVDLTR